MKIMIKYTLFISCFLVNLSAFSRELTNFNQFLITLGQLESSNNPKAYNKSENAIGIYQIRYKYFIDAQKNDINLRKYKHSDCFDVNISKKVVYAYLIKYSKSNNFEEWCYLHNGGTGWKKKTGQAKKNLENYFKKFNSILTKIKIHNSGYQGVNLGNENKKM
jgi:hypothetical protein